jgi:hypothetical protein
MSPNFPEVTASKEPGAVQYVLQKIVGISGLCSQGTRSCGIAARSHDDFSCTGKRNVFVAVNL